MAILENQLLALRQRDALRSRKDGQFDVSVTFDERRGYLGTHPELRAQVTALSLGGLRRKVEAAMLPEEVIVMLSLDEAARLERDRRRLPAGRGRASPGRRPRHSPVKGASSRCVTRSQPVEPCAPSA